MFVQNVYGAPGKIWVSSLLLIGSDAALGVLLIPQFGYRGAIITAIASYALYLVYFVARFAQIRRMVPINTAIRTACAVAIVVLVHLVLAPWLPGGGLVQMAVCLAVYVGSMVAMREVTSADIVFGKSVWRHAVSFAVR